MIYVCKLIKGRTLYYHSLVAEADYRQRVISKCADLWLDGRIDAFVVAFAKGRLLTKEEKSESEV